MGNLASAGALPAGQWVAWGLRGGAPIPEIRLADSWKRPTKAGND
jgi:hypothetical protein